MGRRSLDVLRARDISVTGVGVYVPHGFEGCDIHSGVELVITLPKVRPFKAKGVIKHVTENGAPSEYFGVEFTDLHDSHRAQIEAYVSKFDA